MYLDYQIKYIVIHTVLEKPYLHFGGEFFITLHQRTGWIKIRKYQIFWSSKATRKGYSSYPEDSFDMARDQTLSTLIHLPDHSEGNANMRLLPPTFGRTGYKPTLRFYGKDFFQVDEMTHSNCASRICEAITIKFKVILWNILVPHSIF